MSILGTHVGGHGMINQWLLTLLSFIYMVCVYSLLHQKQYTIRIKYAWGLTICNIKMQHKHLLFPSQFVKRKFHMFQFISYETFRTSVQLCPYGLFTW